MIGFAKYLEDGKTLSFKVIDNRLLKSVSKYGEKMSCLMNIKLYRKPIYGYNSDK